MLAARTGPPAPPPQMKICYLCGNQFGSASIGIHVPQCYNKKLSQWEHGDRATRGQKPRHPDSVNWKGTGMTSAQSQEQQSAEFAANLSSCPNCGRTFLPDRLQVHLRSCKTPVSGRGAAPSRGNATVGQGKPAASALGNSQKSRVTLVPPVLPRCYLCGQQFGTASITIHVPQCYEKKLSQWQAADARTRGQAPKHPDTVNWKGEGLSKDQQNDEQFKEFVNNLEPCPHCNRKFLADRLVIHLRSCKPGNTSKPLSTRGGEENSDAATASASAAPQPPIDEPGPSNRPPRKSPTVRSKSISQAVDPKRNRLSGDSVENTGNLVCAQCGAVEYDTRAKFCRDCGRNLRAKNLHDPCLSCGEKIMEGSLFCSTCGQPVKNSTTNERTPEDEIVTVPTVRMTHCPACKVLTDADGNFCDNCGAALGDAEPVSDPVALAAIAKPPMEKMFCETCNESCMDLTAVYCEECGEKLMRKPATVASLPRTPEKMEATKSTTLPIYPNSTFQNLYYTTRDGKQHPVFRGPKGGMFYVNDSDERRYLSEEQMEALRSGGKTSSARASDPSGCGPALELPRDSNAQSSSPAAPQYSPVEAATTYDTDSEFVQVELAACEKCGRRFAPPSLARHMKTAHLKSKAQIGLCMMQRKSVWESSLQSFQKLKILRQ